MSPRRPRGLKRSLWLHDIRCLIYTNKNGFTLDGIHRERHGMFLQTFEAFLLNLARHLPNVTVCRGSIVKTGNTVRIRRRLIKGALEESSRYIILPVDYPNHVFTYVIDKCRKFLYRVEISSYPELDSVDKTVLEILGNYCFKNMSNRYGQESWFEGDCAPFSIFYTSLIVQTQPLQILSRRESKNFRIRLGEFLTGNVDNWF